MKIPKYRRHSSGRGFVEWKGRRHYFRGGPYGSPAGKKAYNDFVRDVVLADHIVTPRASVTMLGLLEAFVADMKMNGAPSENCHYPSMVELVHNSAAGILVTDFGPLKLKAIRSAMIEKGWSQSYINDQVRRIRSVVRWGVSHELAHPDVLAALMAVPGLRKGRTKAPPPKKIKPVPLRDLAKVIRVAPPTLAAMMRTQWRTGLRSTHLCKLRILDIDMTSYEDVWVYKPVHHEKGNEDVELLCVIGPKTQAVLQPFITDDESAYLFSPLRAMQERGRKPHPGVTSSYRASSYRRAIEYLVKKSGANYFHPHQLRHSAGTNARKHGGLESAQVYLGHAHADVTQVYAEKNFQLAIEVARRIG